jgi:predicted HicB family RNase H-like nuclease
MKNKIIYGVSASGKTENYFKPEIKNWKGKTIAVSFKNEEIDGFNVFHLENPNLSFEEIFSYDKILLIGASNCSTYFNSKTIKGIITYLIENIKNFKEPVLLAIDEFSQCDLSEKFTSSESLMLKLLELDEINTLFIVQDLKQIKAIYKNEYNNIVKLSNILCTKEYEEYSGELRVRFPKSLHKYLKEKSDKEGISLNQYIVYELTKIMD